MSEQIRFYADTRLETRVLSREKQLTIGKDASCVFRVPQEAGLSGRIFYDNGSWFLEQCERRVPLKHGVLLPLHKGLKIAVELIDDNGSRTRINLTKREEWRIGRKFDADIRLLCSQVSGDHAKLYRHNGEWQLCDLNSTNGSFVNGIKTKDAVLREGDEMAIGPYTLTYSVDSLCISGGRVELKPGGTVPQRRAVLTDFNRSPRMLRSVPDGEIEIDAAPVLGGKPEINWLTTLLPALGTLGICGVMTAVTGSTGMLISVPMMLMGTAVTAVSYRSQTKKYVAGEETLRAKYQAYLDEKEEQLRQAARLQRDAACFYHPTPAQCLAMALQSDSRLFERTSQDADFLSLRVGIGEERLRVQARLPKEGFTVQEDSLTAAAREMAKRYEILQDVPVTCDLLRKPVAGIVGERALVVRMAQALLVQLSALHGSDEVRIVVAFSEKEQSLWAWTRWLPHAWNEERTRRFVACGAYESEEMFNILEGELKRRVSPDRRYGEEQPASPHWVFLLTDTVCVPAQSMALLNGGVPGVSCIVLGSRIRALPSGVQQVIEVTTDDGVLFEKNDPAAKRRFTMDQISVADCDAFARALAPIRMRTVQAENQLPQMVTLLEGYHAAEPSEIEIGENWAQGCSWKSLSVPVGLGTGGTYYFDIHEKHGGPHGLVAGCNGSGKSEMAQSWIASMALQFSPRDVNFVLVDFKGTSLLAPLRNLPHLAGSISNLDRDVHRCLQALNYEIERRQRLVDQWNAHDILTYQKKSASNPEMLPMPFLILVIDEFADFKAQFPDFTGALEHIFRGGRSLGVYTLIMTQKPSGVVTEQMYANARFRWCLKVMSESDSREMLGVRGAAYIDTPGRCYVRTDVGTVDAVQPFYSGAPYEQSDEKADTLPSAARVLRSGARQTAGVSEKSTHHGTQLEAVVQTVAEYCRVHGVPCARKLWLPPLDEKLELAQMLPCGRFWQEASDWRSSAAGLCAIIGRLDDPSRQEQRLLSHDFTREGHLLIHGMSFSGKTTLLSTIAISLCSVYAPDQVQVYLMEFGGYGLRTLECLPQVCGTAGDDEPEILAKIIRAFSDELKRRKQLFRANGVGSFAAYREGDQLPAWVLLVDNLSLCCARFYDLTEELIRISREGEAFGLYMAATTTGTTGLNYQLSQNFGRVMTLQLNDPSDYTPLVGRVQNGMPRRTIGRGLIHGLIEFQTAIAFADAGDRERAEKLRMLAERMRQAWTDQLPPKISSLPPTIPYGSIQGEPLLLGVRTEDGQPACLPLKDTVGLWISAADDSAKMRVRRLLLRQLGEMDGLQLFTNVPDAPSNAQSIRDAEMMCATLRALAPELRQRQGERRAGSRTAFSPIVILLDDLTALLESAPDELSSRLEVFVRLGAGLNVTVIVLDVAERMEKLYFGGHILLETLCAHPLLLAGGTSETHRVAEGRTSSHAVQEILERDDWALVKDQSCTAVRPMESEE